MQVRPAPGFEHLGVAEVWLRHADDASWRQASAAARALGLTTLEVWTTDETPAVASFLERRGFEIVRRYAISELDVATAPAPEPPRIPLTTLARRPDVLPGLYELAVVAYRDQPGREASRLPPLDDWRGWSVDPHPHDAFFVALDDARVLGYGYLAVDGDAGTHGFTAVARDARGRGVAGSIKRAQIAWARERGLRTLRAANELRLTQMLALNAKLGYRRLHTELVLRGPLAPRDA
ncbi:MAG TPA: GNAT family N-acetyltransferase [Gaiellaceae bacterium]|nr:GNAT family N-acetyltransferase [Gaiellaceae bacterium]